MAINQCGFGSPTRARTWDLRINSPSLYQLSYRGTTCNYSDAVTAGSNYSTDIEQCLVSAVLLRHAQAERPNQEASLIAGIDRTDNTPSIPERSRMTASWIALSTSTNVYAISPRDLFTMVWMLSPARAIVVEI